MIKSGDIPLVSVIMPVFNAEEFVEQAIASILAQSYKKLEFLIIDDGSQDSTVEKIIQFKDSRIRLLTNERSLGIAASLNKGIIESKGKYIARMDADDISLKNRIEKQFDFMENNPQIGILGTGYYEINKQGERKKAYIYPNDDMEIKWKLLMGPIFPHPTVMFRKDVLIAFNINYNINYSATQDYELWSRLIHYTDGTNLPIPLLEYRHHYESFSETNTRIQERLRFQVSAQSLTKLTKTRIVSANLAEMFEKVVNYNFDSLSIPELKKGCELFFHALNNFYYRTYNSNIAKTKWRMELLFNFFNHFEKYIRKNIVDNESKINTPSIEFLQLRIIQKSLRCMLVYLKPEQLIYYPPGIIVYSIQLMKRLLIYHDKAIIKY